MILVFVDMMNSDEEIPEYREYLEKIGIAAKVTDSHEAWRGIGLSAYTHVFLDYGGMDLPGNSVFSHMNEVLRKTIEDHPSIEFVIISVMGKVAFENELDFDAPNLHCMKNFRDKKELQEILDK
ncbi:MAG TPA: hypothetical protein VMW32_03670 [Bacteroidales bacterium]|nr:hypothetical protein [Bacteroidales bacterium]